MEPYEWDAEEAAHIESTEAPRHRRVIDPPEEVAILERLGMWALDSRALLDAAARAARWAVAKRNDDGPEDAPAPAARLDELADDQRTHLLERIAARARVAYSILPPAPALELADGWRIDGTRVVHIEPSVSSYPFRVPDALPEREGMLAHTRAILEHLEAYIDRCADAPEVERLWLRDRLALAAEDAEDDWRAGTPLAFWDPREGELDRGPPWVNLIALAVWVLEVGWLVRRALRPVALKVASLQGLTAALARGPVVEVLGAGPGTAPARAWVTTAALDAEALERIRKGTGMLDTPLAPRMVAYMAHAIQRRLDPRAPLEWTGGEGRNAWDAVGAELGITDPGEVRKQVRPLLETLGHLHYRSPSGREVGGLWTTDYRPGGGRGKVGRLIVTPNAGICGIVEDADPEDERMIVPIPELPGWCAPMVGRRNEHGAYSRLWLWTLCRLREHADELYRGNGVLIDGATWAAAGLEVGLRNPEPLLVPHGLVARWTQGADDGPPVLEERSPNRYHLAAHLEADRAMLEEAGRRTVQGRKGGKAAAERRANPSARRAKKPRGF